MRYVKFSFQYEYLCGGRDIKVSLRHELCYTLSKIPNATGGIFDISQK